MQLPAGAKEGLERGEVVFDLGEVDEADGLQEFVAVGLMDEPLGLELAYMSPAVHHLLIARPHRALGEYAQLRSRFSTSFTTRSSLAVVYSATFFEPFSRPLFPSAFSSSESTVPRLESRLLAIATSIFSPPVTSSSSSRGQW